MKFQLKRLLSQILIFFSANLGAFGLKTGFCYPFFYCHSCPASTSACPLRALEQSVYSRSFTWYFFVYPILILGFFGALTGRAVCGWACPIGLLQRATGKVARRLKKYQVFNRIPTKKIDKYLKYAKYFVLIGLVILTSWLIGFMLTDICPIGFLTGTIPTLLLYPGKFVPNTFFSISLIIFILFFILIFTVERGWCRYFCPIGALLAPFNKISYLHVSRVEEEKFDKECIKCDACSKICPMGIDVTKLFRDPECILCGKCVKACPKNLIEFRRG
jgi:ferredoxin-type protein NapH